MWGGVPHGRNNPTCDWSGDGDRSVYEFDKCPDLKIYSDGADCDPSCTLTGGTKESKHSECVWPNVNSV